MQNGSFPAPCDNASLRYCLLNKASDNKGPIEGIFIATNSFTYDECQYLASILTKNYNLKTSVIKSGHLNQWRIFIWKESMPILREILEPYFICEMKYKLGI